MSQQSAWPTRMTRISTAYCSRQSLKTGILLLLGVTVVLMAGCPVSTPTPTISAQYLAPTACPSGNSAQIACGSLVYMCDANGPANNGGIWYSFTGAPVPNSTANGTLQYNGPIQVNGPGQVTVTAVAQAPGQPQSPYVATTVNCPAPPAPPTFNPPPLTTPPSCPLQLSVTPNPASYTTPLTVLVANGTTTPSPSNNIYTGGTLPVNLTANSNVETFSAIDCTQGLNPVCSSVATFAYSCAAQQQTPTPYSQLVVTILTGSDGLNSDSSVSITPSGAGLFASGTSLCLKADKANCPVNGPLVTQSPPVTGTSWPASQDTTIFIPISPMTAAAAQNFAGTLQIQLKNGDPQCGQFGHEGCDNWQIQAITAALQSDPNCTRGNCGPPVNLLSLSGPTNANDNNCIVFLKAPPNATTVQFSLGGGTNSHTYLNGTAAENGITTTCKDNGDGGPVP
jgi:hypothetical protein